MSLTKILRAALLLVSTFVLFTPIAAQTNSTNASPPTCFDNPSQYSCRSFTMPEDDIITQMTDLCTEMPNMVGCTLWTSCQSGATGQYCQPMSLYGTICEEMGDMKGCAPYKQLCFTDGSVVQQCKKPGPLPGAPSTVKALEAVLTMCGSHSMPGCEKCTARASCPHPMEVLAQVCLEMPSMAQCADFTRMCSAGSDTFKQLCGTDGTSLPPMKMWMHAGINDILLFKEWVPQNGGEYAGYLIMCIVGAVFVQGLKAWRVRLEASWAAQQRVSCCSPEGCGTDVDLGRSKSRAGSSTSSNEELHPLPGGRFKKLASSEKWQFVIPNRSQRIRNFIRSVFTFVIVFLDYMLMLLVMSFNIGIIFATVSGFAIGAFLFGHWGERAGSGTAVAVGEVAPDSENDLEVHFMEATTCCNARQV